MDEMSDLPLILASSSPRRRELMTEWGYRFTVVAPSDAAEGESTAHVRESAQQLVSRLALQKARDVAGRVARGIVIGCDTVAECSGQILGKPNDREHARQMLVLLRGQEHHVYSGLCLWRRPDDVYNVQVAVTNLHMSPLSDDQLDAYLATGQWQGKAGGFGYQDRLGWIHIAEGSESNVVGLPLELLAQLLPRL